MSQQWQWDDVQVVLALVESGTLTAAARQLGLGVATVSRRLERMERSLALRLFSRHPQGYRLTDDGQALLPRMEALARAGEALSGQAQAQAQAVGTVRMATADNLASSLILPHLGSLLMAHPGLNVELVTGVYSVNMLRREADLAIRMVRPTQTSLIVRRLGMMGYGLYSRAVAEDGPQSGAKGERPPLIAWPEGYGHLPAKLGREHEHSNAPRVMTNTLLGQVAAVKAGLGMALLPHFLGIEHGLQCIESVPEASQTIWLVMHQDLAHSRRVRTVADFMISLCEQHQALLAGDVVNGH